MLRVPMADGTLVATPDVPSGDLVRSFLAVSDVLGTGWFAADAANVKPGATVVVVGDGAVGLLGVLAAKQMGAERIIAMSRHAPRQTLAREFGATDIVTERGDAGVERIRQLTEGVGADSVLECVGTHESMLQAIRSTRPGGFISYVGVPHGIQLDGAELFYTHVRLHGGPAPVRRYLPELIQLVQNGSINPGKVFDLELPLEQVAEGYRAMERAPRDQDAASRVGLALHRKESCVMSGSLRFVIAVVCVALPITTSTELSGSHGTAAAQDDRERFVGAWRLAWMEEPGPDGKITRIADRKGTLMYTRDGRMSVQIQFPESQSSVSNDYILNGYEASFGTYEVNEEAKTITRHVEGSITRGLIGKSLTRAYRFADGRLTMRSVRPEERWSTTWERH
jgi:hypothetical protein